MSSNRARRGMADAERAVSEQFDTIVSGSLRYGLVMKMVEFMGKDIVTRRSQEGAEFTIASRDVELDDRVPEHSGSQRRPAPWVEVAEEEDGNGQFPEEPAEQ
ncbi:MAG: hypothetical protein H5U38_01265 [Calditrichaeota bacterium]|nr:hypothetical protein [Calditrichota bacterium]